MLSQKNKKHSRNIPAECWRAWLYNDVVPKMRIALYIKEKEKRENEKVNICISAGTINDCKHSA